MTSKSPVPVEVFLDEYSRDDVIAKYLTDTAGAGIAHALTHVYAPVYLEVINALIARRPRGHAFRILEYGCGGGMNLVKVVELLRQRGADIQLGIGVDFSPPMVEAARHDSARQLPRGLRDKITFAVANNETLAPDLAKGLGCGVEDIEGTFDVIVGVNTFRYCHRLAREGDCARDIFALLRPGGSSIMIDMNQRFPLFRSRIADLARFRRSEESFLPSLEDYARPFAKAGFKITQKRNFCWFPHSAGPTLVTVCRAMAPVLDVFFTPFAMRSLVVAERPA